MPFLGPAGSAYDADRSGAIVPERHGACSRPYTGPSCVWQRSSPRLSLSAAAANAGAAGPLRTGFVDPGAFAGPNGDEAVTRARTAGATLTRVVFWNTVETAVPADRGDPNDPAYNWASVDGQVERAVAAGVADPQHHARPEVGARSKRSACPATWPSPARYAQFAKAAARRYSGIFSLPAGETEALPRVRYWQPWNEPNAGANLSPPSASAG